MNLSDITYREARQAAIDYAEDQWKNNQGDVYDKQYAQKDFMEGVNWLRERLMSDTKLDKDILNIGNQDLPLIP